MQFRVGAMVLAALLITGILVALFGNMPLLLKPEDDHLRAFAEAPGVAPTRRCARAAFSSAG